MIGSFSYTFSVFVTIVIDWFITIQAASARNDWQIQIIAGENRDAEKVERILLCMGSQSGCSECETLPAPFWPRLIAGYSRWVQANGPFPFPGP
jgi:hypothetical protein